MPDNVKCVDCGYLTMRHRKTGNLVAADDLLRDRGYLFHSESVGRSSLIYDEYPVCFVDAISFRKVIARPIETDIKAAIDTVRNCQSFTERRSGRSPKEYLDMERLAEIERRNELWRTEEIERAQARHDQDIEWREQTEAKIERRHRSQFVLQALIAALTVAASIVGSLIAVGKIELW